MECVFTITRGPRKGEPCLRNTAGAKYCSRHRKLLAKSGRGLELVESKNIQQNRANEQLNRFMNITSSAPIDNAPITTNFTPPKVSMYMFTINTNKTVDSLDYNSMAAFRNILDDLFRPPNIHDTMDDTVLQFLVPRLNGKDWRYYPVIRSAHADIRFEVGPESKNLHAHGMLYLIHDSIFTIDNKAMRAYLNNTVFGGRDPGRNGIYLNIKAQGDNRYVAWRAYMEKQQEYRHGYRGTYINSLAGIKL